VPHVPDELVARGVEGAVQRHGELHRSQVGAEVSALVGRHHVDHAVAHFLAEGGKLLGRQRADVRWVFDSVEKCHGFLLTLRGRRTVHRTAASEQSRR
jgi:hypothetical protein